MSIFAQTTSYSLTHADQALADLRAGRCEGADVLVRDGVAASRAVGCSRYEGADAGSVLPLLRGMLVLTCGELLERGDIAVRDHDMRMLVRVALALSARIGDPISDQLRELARVCRRNARMSVHGWPVLRAAVADRIAIAGT
jgi:hypothetical protein